MASGERENAPVLEDRGVLRVVGGARQVWRRLTGVWCGSADQPTVAQRLQRLVEDGLAVGLAAALLHVGQVRLVRLDPRCGRRVLLVLSGRQPAAGAVPGLGDAGARLLGEAGPGLVTVGAPVGDEDTGGGVAALGLPHRSGTDTAAPNRVTTGHGVLLGGIRSCGRPAGLPPAAGAVSWRSARSGRDRRWQRPRPGRPRR